MFAENNETLIGWKGMLRERGGSAKQPSTVTFVRDITLGWGGALNKILHFDISDVWFHHVLPHLLFVGKFSHECHLLLVLANAVFCQTELLTIWLHISAQYQ